MKKIQILSALLLIVLAMLLLFSCDANDTYDAYAAERVAAQQEIATAEVVKNNPADLGIAALVAESFTKLAAAPDADAIRTVVSDFNADAEAHASAKAELVDELRAVDLSDFFSSSAAKLLEEILLVRDDALMTVKTASTLADAEASLASYKEFVRGKIVEIPFGPCGGNEEFPGMKEKLELLGIIEEYEERAQLLILNLTAAYENGEISEEEYQLKMYGKEAEGSGEAVFGYEYALARIAWWKEYVPLAIKLDGLQSAFEAEVGPLLAPFTDAQL